MDADVSRRRDGGGDRRRSRSRTPPRRKRSRSRSYDRYRRRSRSRSPDYRRRGGGGGGGGGHRRGGDRDRYDDRDSRRAPPREPEKAPEPELEPLSAEERDLRTVLVTSLSPKLTESKLKEIFTRFGPVRAAKLITEKFTGKSKGYGYVEFVNEESVVPACTLTGTVFELYPIIVKLTDAAKNRQKNTVLTMFAACGPTKIHVSSLPPQIEDDDLDHIFSKVGKIIGVDIEKDESGKPTGVATVQYTNADDARRAMIHVDGLSICDRIIRVGLVSDSTTVDEAIISSSFCQQAAMFLGQKRLPPPPLTYEAALGAMAGLIPGMTFPLQPESCFLKLSPLFTLKELEEDPAVKDDIYADVEEQIQEFGVEKIHVDSSSNGDVYVQMKTVEGARSTMQKLNGRKFMGQVVVVTYLPEAQFQTHVASASSSAQ